MFLSLAALCSSPYWNRLWIVQEILLAKKLTIYAGIENGMSFSWDEWSKARKALGNIPAEWQLPPVAMDALEIIMSSLPVHFDKQRERGAGSWPLHALLSMCESSLCQEPRDKIYGLLSLAADFQAGDIAIDYSKSLFDLYIDIVEFHNSSHRKRQELSFSTVAFSQIVQRVLDGPIEVSERTFEPLILFNRVQTFEPMTPSEQILRPRALTASSFLNRLTNGAFRIEGFKKGTILPLDILVDETTIRDLQKRDSLCVLADYVPHLSRPEASLMLERLDALKRRRIITMRTAVSYTGTSFFVASFGEFGIASTAIREDDVLCRFANCDVGIIIRQNNDAYFFVSRAVLAPEPLLTSGDKDTSTPERRHEESMSF